MNKLNLTSIHIPTWQAEHDKHMAKLKAKQDFKQGVKRNAIYLLALCMVYAGIVVFTAL